MEFVPSSELNSRSGCNKLWNNNVHFLVHNGLHFYAARIKLRFSLKSTRPFLAITGCSRVTRVDYAVSIGAPVTLVELC
jgi:hypothetical protein